MLALFIIFLEPSFTVVSCHFRCNVYLFKYTVHVHHDPLSTWLDAALFLLLKQVF